MRGARGGIIPLFRLYMIYVNFSTKKPAADEESKGTGIVVHKFQTPLYLSNDFLCAVPVLVVPKENGLGGIPRDRGTLKGNVPVGREPGIRADDKLCGTVRIQKFSAQKVLLIDKDCKRKIFIRAGGFLPDPISERRAYFLKNPLIVHKLPLLKSD